MEKFDIILDEQGDELHESGDLALNECTLQCQKLLLITAKTAIKHEPTTGVDIGSFVLDERDGAELKADIQNEFEADGLSIVKLRIPDLQNISIVSEYAV
jgi:hypothetical protein